MPIRSPLVASFALVAVAVAGFAAPAVAQVPAPSLSRVTRALLDGRSLPAEPAARHRPAPARRAQAARPVFASAADRRWELEVHGQFASGSNPGGGTSRLPAPGAFFLLADGLTMSRAVSSWYLGDGAALFNQVEKDRGIVSTKRIAPLDAALIAEVVGRDAGGQVGFRVGRVITPRFSAEFLMDIGLNHLSFARLAVTDIESSRLSFVNAITAMTNSTTTLLPNPAVTSTATIVNHVGTQMLIAGNVTFAFTSGSANTPYVILGEGVAIDRGPNPSVRLVGDYTVTTPGGASIHQTDTVTISTASTPTVMFTLGAGYKRRLTDRTGVRLEMRMTMTANRMNALIDAAPVSVGGTPTGAAVLNATNPGLQFSSQTSARNSLSGAPITNFIAFEGSGVRYQSGLSIGYYLRF